MQTQEEREAQLERSHNIQEDPLTTKLKTLVRTGWTQGLEPSQFKDMIYILEERFLKSPVCVPGSVEGAGFFREGQNDTVRYLKRLCEEEGVR